MELRPDIRRKLELADRNGGVRLTAEEARAVLEALDAPKGKHIPFGRTKHVAAPGETK